MDSKRSRAGMCVDITKPQKPLGGLRCLVCGMLDSKPIEEALSSLGAKVVSLHKHSQTAPDVVVSDRAGAKRLQCVLEQHKDVPIVTSEWARVCKSTGQRVPFSDYSLPALKDCSVSFTNLTRRERAAYQAQIMELGGTVAADMSKTCSHLVVGDPHKVSAKLKAAMDWHIPAVSLAWLTRTLKSRRIIPTSNYRIEMISGTCQAPNQADTLGNKGINNDERKSACGASKSGVSASTVPCGSTGMSKEARIRADTTVPVPSVSVLPDKPSTIQTIEKNEGAPCVPANPLPQTQAGILEHLQIYLCELGANDHVECVDIINRHRGSRSMWLSPYITHIIVGSDCQEQEKCQVATFMHLRGGECSVVSPDWLRACDKTRSLPEVGQYSIDISSWMARYSGSDTKTQSTGIMAKYKFFLDSLDNSNERQQAKEYVRSLGGQALTSASSRLVQDWKDVYAICPDSLPPAKAQQLQRRSECFGKVPPGNRVNMFWLKQCRVGQQVYDPSCALFRPIPHNLPLSGFSSVCIVISGFGDGVRRAILNCIKVLGGTCLETVTTDQWAVVTHLLCRKGEGPKYKRSREKRIPTVSLKWLLVSISSGKVEPCDDYIVHPETDAHALPPEPLPSVMGPTQGPSQAHGSLLVRRSRPVRRPVSGSALQPSNTRGSQMIGFSTSLLGSDSCTRQDSLLMQLSQGLSAPQRGDDAEPGNFRDLKNLVPASVRNTPSDAAAAAPLCATAQNRTPDNHNNRGESQQLLNRFAEAHGLALDSILSGSKRKADEPVDDAKDSCRKRACTGSAAPAHQQDNGQSPPSEANVATRAANTEADAQPDNCKGGAITRVAVTVLPQLQNGLLDISVMHTQPLHLTQCGNASPSGLGAEGEAPQLPCMAALGKRIQQQPLHVSQGVMSEQQDLWLSEKDPEIHATQVTFSQKIDYLANSL